MAPFSEIDLSSPKLGQKYEDRYANLCTIIQKIAEGLGWRSFPRTSTRWATLEASCAAEQAAFNAYLHSLADAAEGRKRIEDAME